MGIPRCSTSDAKDRVSTPKRPARHCPRCDRRGPAVDRQTVVAVTRGPVAPTQEYWLCRHLGCSIVYHGDQGATCSVDDLHVVPGFKVSGPEGIVCYCFLHSRGEIEADPRTGSATTVAQRITAEIKAGNCACEVRNPEGRCCLGEVRRIAGRS